MPPKTILTVAPEVKLRIFSHLSDLDLVRCSLVCVLFRKVIARSALLQYRVELSFEGLVDGHPDGPNVTDRLRLLLDHRSNWLNLKWKKHDSINLEGYLLHYAPGIFVTLRIKGNTRPLTFYTLPSSNTQLEIRQGPPHERRPDGIACDISQDLLVIFERDDPVWEEDDFEPSGGNYRLRFLTLSSLGDKPHPDAAVPVIEAEYMPGDNYETTLSVAGDLLGVWGNLAVDVTISVLNWKTGQHLVEIDPRNSPSSFDYVPGGYTFATSRLLILFSSAHGGCLQIQPIPGKRRMVLCLPSPKHRSQRDPRIFEIATASSSRPGVSFVTSSDSGVYLLDIFEGQLALFFKHSSLTSLLAEHLWGHSTNEPVIVPRKEWDRPTSEPVIVPWKEWGPCHARVLRCRTLLNDTGCVYDSRAVLHMADMAGAQDALADVTPYILDFNLIRHQRPVLDSEAHGDTASNGKWTLIDESTSISVPEYEEPIITNLPYYIAPAPGSEQHTRYCIDDERIIGITQAPRSDMAGEVTVYSF